MSKFNNKWFKFVENNIETNQIYSFNDFIFNDGFKRKINLTKLTKNIWLFTIICSDESDENCYSNIIKFCTNEKTYFKIFNPTLDKINEKLSNINICKYHITCEGICELEFINTPEEKCPICLKDFEKHYLIRTICGHYFCLPCLNLFIKEERKCKDDDDDNWYIIPCPLCRENICDI
jgi:hypothetical protein